MGVEPEGVDAAVIHPLCQEAPEGVEAQHVCIRRDKSGAAHNLLQKARSCVRESLLKIFKRLACDALDIMRVFGSDVRVDDGKHLLLQHSSHRLALNARVALLPLDALENVEASAVEREWCAVVAFIHASSVHVALQVKCAEVALKVAAQRKLFALGRGSEGYDKLRDRRNDILVDLSPPNLAVCARRCKFECAHGRVRCAYVRKFFSC